MDEGRVLWSIVVSLVVGAACAPLGIAPDATTGWWYVTHYGKPDWLASAP